MKLSVIIPCYNDVDTIGAQLEALANQDWSGLWEVIVADNGSTDNSLAMIERYKQRLPNLRILDASARRGPSFARNEGARAATGDALLFCDGDDEVAPGWLSALGEALTQHDFVACSIDIEKLNGHRNWAHPQRDKLQALWFPPHLPHAGGGTLGVKRWLHEVVGGFDEDLLAHEDTFYCVKIQFQGTVLHFVPKAILHLRFRSNHREEFRQARIYGYYETLMYKKCRKMGIPNMHGAWKVGISSWADILRRVARIRCLDHAKNISWDLGLRIGRLQGSIVYRVIAI